MRDLRAAIKVRDGRLPHSARDQITTALAKTVNSLPLPAPRPDNVLGLPPGFATKTSLRLLNPRRRKSTTVELGPWDLPSTKPAVEAARIVRERKGAARERTTEQQQDTTALLATARADAGLLPPKKKRKITPGQKPTGKA